MPKHKRDKNYSSRRSRDKKSSRKHSSCESSRERRSRDRSRSESKPRGKSRSSFSPGNLRPSRNSSSRHPLASENLLDMLDQVRRLLAHRADDNLNDREQFQEVRAPTGEFSTGESLAIIDEPASTFSTSPLPLNNSASEQLAEEQTVTQQADRGVEPGMSSCPRHNGLYRILENRGHNRLFPSALSVQTIPVARNGSPPSGSVQFSDPPAPDVLGPHEQGDPENTLVRELFGGTQASQAAAAWNPLVLQSIHRDSRSGLNDDVRAKLLARYEVKGDLAGLAAPKLNKELVSALTPSVVKRDEYQSLSQAQVGACLNAFGSGISVFLKQEVVQSLNEEAIAALSSLSEGIHLLSDHQYRLSLARRAFTKPSLNIIGKNAADSAPIDEFLFGLNFAEALKAAQACDKAGREVIKPTQLPGKKTLQPVRQQAQSSRLQPQTSKTSGNQRAPVRTSSARKSGASYQKSRHHRGQSRSRSRFHR